MSSAVDSVPGSAAAPRFTEREPYEAGFAAIFDREVAQRLVELEQERLAQKATVLRRLAAILGGSVALVALAGLIWGWNGFLVALVVLLIVDLIAVSVYAMRPAGAFADRVRGAVMGPLCRFLGDVAYDRKGRFDARPYVDCGVVGRYTSGRIEDVFTGRHRGTGFEMAEARLTRTSGHGKNRRTTTVFRGLLCAVEVPEPFAGRVLIGRDFGRLGNKLAGWANEWASGMTRIHLPHDAFEARYEVYADDPAEAERLLSPGFCDTMVALADAHGKAALQAGFVGGRFLLALPMSGDLFEPGSLFRSVYSYEDNIHKVLRQVTIAHRLIDYLHGHRPGWLA